MARLFITGGTGYLGGALARLAQARGDTVVATYFSQTPPHAPVTWLPLDVCDALAVEEALDQARPDVVLHTAYRQYDPGLWAVTAEGARNVAAAAHAVGSRLIHMSSDVIFDGERGRAYTEDDPPAPISAYGRAKGAAEQFVREQCPAAAIVRTSLIYGFEPIDMHTRFVLDVADGRQQARLFHDEFRCPIFVDDLAAALLELAATDYAGILHVAGAERLSRHAFGVLLARAHGRDPGLLPGGLSAESPLRRPRDCTLAIERAQALLRTPLRGVPAVIAAAGYAPGDI